ncbi:Pentatricopeptide repeat-containing protein [Striga hermonthica]|uniref:Pentatricopeptide repeat-containing protein n=1 Tax=Striga hermonthica TaxID=68872 RepID=A0A9N7NM32_STRHE|nr:Pentatricopeptide repeat-containing protein [Striga hermonthica]
MSCPAQSMELTVLISLRRCTHIQLKQIHAVITTATLIGIPEVRLKLLRRSTEFGEMDYPERIFAHMGGQAAAETPLWNAMVRGYAYNGPYVNCLKLFDEMSLRGLCPNNHTFPYVLNACSQMGLFGVGRKVHGRALKSGFLWAFTVGNALFDFYVKMAECLEGASSSDDRKAFDETCEKTVNLWNKMIGRYVNEDDVKNARKLFDEMPERDAVSWNTMISAYAKAGNLAAAWHLFNRSPCKNVVTWTTMIGAHAAKGDVKTAREVFDMMPDKNVVSWNCMFAGYNRAGEFQKALDLFSIMQSENVDLDSYTLAAALTACSYTSDLELGKRVHSMIRDWPETGIIVGSALVQMYANCGDIDRAFTTFVKIGHKDVFSYNIMIKSLAIHGRAKDGIKIFDRMLKRGLRPNEYTYSCALFACSHGGLVKEGRAIFKGLERDSDVGPSVYHYCTMVDLLCRNDRLEEAKSLVDGMKVEPDIAVWGALLRGCKERGNLGMAESVSRKIVELGSDEAGVHVLLSNIRASMGEWSGKVEARKLMDETGIWKRAGSSSIA